MPAAKSIRLPNFLAFCSPDFRLETNRHCRAASESSQKWALASGFLDSSEQEALPSENIGLLAALCYPTCDASPLHATAQFLTILLHWKGKSAEQIDQALLSIRPRLSAQSDKSWLSRFDAHLGSSRDALARLKQSEAMKFTSLEQYLENARDASGFMAAFDLIEYAEGLDIPENAFNSSILTKLRTNAANIVTWTLDIAAYCQQRPRGETRNLVVVLMEENRFAPQGAMDLAGALVKVTLENFRENEKLLPSSFGNAAVDADVRVYVRGLRAWIVGSIHWIYETERYFGRHREDARALGWMFLSELSASTESVSCGKPHSA